MASSLRAEIAAILACTAATLAFAPVVLAQQADEDEDITVAAPAEEPDDEARLPGVLDQITVTGSRLRRDEYTSTSPITVITSERSALAGLLTTEEILQKSTIASGQQINDSFSGFVVDGGPGTNSVSLRGLGAQRTLVLVNGRRWTPSGIQGFTNNVDLSAIPSSIVGRIEILKDGASSIYGADAVAGVVNLITKESLDGLQLNAQVLATQEGGGERYVFDVSWGKVTDRGSISFSAQYAKQESLQAADRRWSRCPTRPRTTDQDGDGVIDNSDPFTGEQLCFGFIYGLGSTALGFLRYEPSLTDPFDTSNPFFDPRTAQFGLPFYTRLPPSGLLKASSPPLGPGGQPAPIPLFDNEGPLYRDELSPGISNIQTPNELLSATSFGQIDLDFGATQSEAYYEAFFNSRKTRASGGYRQFFPVVEGLTFDGANLHPNNPFAFIEGLAPGLGFFQAVLPSYELLDPVLSIDVDRYNVFAGLRGDLGTRGWYYDAYVGYGRSTGTYREQQLLADRVEAAVNGVIIDGGGNVVCAPEVLAQFPDCVPADLSTEDALLRGRLPADVLSFIRKDTEGRTTYEGVTLSGYVTGEMFSVPAGRVGVVLGAEFREESINDVPDIEAQNDNFWGSTTSGITKGRDNVSEVFGEVEVPLLAGMRFAEELTFTGAARWTDYKSYGSDVTYKLGMAWTMTPQVLLRSTFGTSFRAPALFEQFLADSTGFTSNLADPCINYGIGRSPGDPVYDNCAAEGLDEDFSATSSILVVTGGASDLEAETSDAFTIGVAYTPDWADISFAIDYFDIKLKDTVASPGVGFILGECYNSTNFSSPFCTRVGGRNAFGELNSVDTSFVNVGRQQTRGMDFNAVYQREFPIGRLIVDGTATYIDRQNFEVFDQFTTLEGRWGFPRWTASGQTSFDYRDWRFTWSQFFIGKSKEQPVFDPGTTNIDRRFRTPNTLYHTVSTRYSAANWQAIFTVRNLFDKDPPPVGDGQGAQGANRIYNTLPGVGYDLFGRTFVLQLAYQF